MKLAAVPIIMNHRGIIFFINQFDGNCFIKEIRPQNDEKQNHLNIYEIKSEYCLGFGVSDDSKTFYFMDDFKVINQLQRMKGSRNLTEVGELMIKDKDRPHLSKQSQWEEMLFSDKYLVQRQKIFYLFDDQPLEQGILDMEDLSEVKDFDNKAKKEYVLGPFSYKGSNEFVTVFRYGESQVYKGRIFQTPDSQVTSLCCDMQKKVDLTTFLNSGEILMKINCRYMVFDKFGEFIDEVEFEELKKEQDDLWSKLNKKVAEQESNKLAINEESEGEDSKSEDKDEDKEEEGGPKATSC
jgi:hypothetical protein